jgi:hypothetical protein
MRNFAVFVCTTPVYLTLSGFSAQARDCDPAKILVRDTFVSSYEQQTTLVKNKTKESNSSQNENSQAAVGLADIGNLSGGQSVAFSNAVRDVLHIDYSDRKKRWEVFNWLSDNAREAFVDCLKADGQNIFLYPSAESMTSETMSIKVELRSFVTRESISAKFYSPDAKILSPTNATKMSPGGTKVVYMTRKLDKSMSFSADVGEESAEITLPAMQPYKLERQLRWTTGVTHYGHPSNDSHDGHQICVNIDPKDEAIIIPNTTHFVPAVDVADGIRTVVNPVSTYNPKQACAEGVQSVGAKNANLNFCGYASVLVLAKVPLKGEYTYSQAPAYLNNPGAACSAPAGK